MSWDPISQPIDHVVLGGRSTPGLATLEGADSPRRFDERDGYGLSGATVVYRGTKLSHFVLKIRLYSDQDWAEWYAFKDVVDKPPLGTRAKALSIWHPFTEALGIATVVVENVGQPDQTDDGEWTIEIRLIEFRTPKFTLAKPEGAKATPVDPVDQQIIDQDQQIHDLAGP